jgi:hypothetical protein
VLDQRPEALLAVAQHSLLVGQQERGAASPLGPAEEQDEQHRG